MSVTWAFDQQYFLMQCMSKTHTFGSACRTVCHRCRAARVRGRGPPSQLDARRALAGPAAHRPPKSTGASAPGQTRPDHELGGIADCGALLPAPFFSRLQGPCSAAALARGQVRLGPSIRRWSNHLVGYAQLLALASDSDRVGGSALARPGRAAADRRGRRAATAGAIRCRLRVDACRCPHSPQGAAQSFREASAHRSAIRPQPETLGPPSG